MTDPARTMPESRGARIRRKTAAWLLLADALSAAVGVATLLPGLAMHAAPVIARIVLRAGAGMLEGAGGFRLLNGRASGAALGRAGSLVAALYVTLGIGFRLAPSSLDPSLRLPMVALYWLFAAIVWLLLACSRVQRD